MVISGPWKAKMTKKSTIAKWKDNVANVTEEDFLNDINATDTAKMDRNYAKGLKAAGPNAWKDGICGIDGLPQEVAEEFGCK